MSDSKDAALAAKGDFEAFERLYRRYLSRIYSLCARLSGSRAEGQALTEDVFVRTWEMLPQFSGETAFAAWLHRLATDVALNGRKVYETPAAAIQQGGSATERWNDSASSSEDDERLDLSQAIDRLPADARRILVLHDVEGYQHEEIAEIFGITPGRSKAQLQRARVVLREVLGR
jgi:RNA polymerase sigma-70 factor (ECF subfamily)